VANADPESRAAGKGWVGDFGLVVEAEPGKLRQTFAVYCVPRNGQITGFRVLRDPDEFEEFEPRYLASAPYSVWKGLLQGTVDAIQAVAQRKLRFVGDLEPLVQRMKYKGIVERVLARIQTEFPDEPG
jgi:putative sterol carrier protein